MFLGYPSREKRVPLRMLVPNMVTTASMCCGLAAMHFALKQDFDRAVFAVMAAAILDALDGRLARMLRASSPIGAVLDSLADFLAFGVAPAMVLHLWKLKDAGVSGLAAVATFAICAAWRLARFTAAAQAPRTDRPDKPEASRFFVGMPSPAAAGCALIPVVLDQSKHVKYESPAWLVVAFTMLIAVMMIGRQPMFSFKKVRIPRRRVMPLMVVCCLVIIAATQDPYLVMASLAAAYLLSTPLAFWAARRPAPAESPAATELRASP